MKAIIRHNKEIVSGFEVVRLEKDCVIIGKIRKMMVNIQTGEILQEFYRLPPEIAMDPEIRYKKHIRKLLMKIAPKE